MKERVAREKIARVIAQPKKVLIGRDEAVEMIVKALFTRVSYDGQGRKEYGQAHVLLLDVPGVGKSCLTRSLACAIGATSVFIVGHPEMMRSELMGSEIYNPHLNRFFLRKGPIFHHILMWDEINRTHQKGLAGGLQALEERLAVVEATNMETGELEEKAFPLLPVPDDPEGRLFFWVVANGNLVEHAGTYPLPETLLERFTLSLSIGYPQREKEMLIRPKNLHTDENGERVQIEQVISLREVLDIGELIHRTVVSPRGQTTRADEYMMRIIENSRPGSVSRHSATPELRDLIDETVEEGLSPRSNLHLDAMAVTNAFFAERTFVSVDDVRAIAPFVMRHRIKLAPAARRRGIAAADEVVRKILDNTEVP